jgi:hypothetical protein
MSPSVRVQVLAVIFPALLLALESCGSNSSTVANSQSWVQKQAPTIILSAQPTQITVGSAAVLTWSTSNAISVSINGLGTVSASGSVHLTPRSTTTYAATATGPGGKAHASTTITVQALGSGRTFPSFGHVLAVLEENHSYSSVIGNSAMPYLNGLAQQYGLATQYFANTHPSIGNYFMLTTGKIITNDDGFKGKVDADNVVRHLLTVGKTWKSYAESLPNTGYTGGDVYPYVKHHNPFAYLTDVVNSKNQVNNLVPFSLFSRDLKNNQLPQYSFIIPNMQNDAHDGSLSQADKWLSSNIAPLIASSTFKKDGLLIMLFDESISSDKNHGGGQVAWVVVSPKAKKGYKSKTLYQHESTLRLMLQGLGLTSFPGAAQNAPQMGEFF